MVFMQALSNPGDALALEVTQDLPSGIVAWRTGERLLDQLAEVRCAVDTPQY